MSLKVKNYKCFGEEPQGFERVRSVNLLIGRNNSGKSTLLDLVQYVVSAYDLKPNQHRGGGVPKVLLSGPITGELAHKVLENVALGTDAGKRITYELGLDGVRTYVETDKPLQTMFSQPNHLNGLVQRSDNPFAGKRFVRLNADRDLRPEAQSNDLAFALGTGIGATNLIRAYLTDLTKKSKLVEQNMLNDLNAIFADDYITFDRIAVKHNPRDGKWEVCLHEKNKEVISLSNSGSGLKTIILVLSCIHLLPDLQGPDLSNFIFAFEELENNLHPALQRRLTLYLHDKAVKTGCIVFMTTHSSVSIDLLSSDTNSQIIHVKHDGSESVAEGIVEYASKTAVLDDLDIRASDLLQSNCIVWVEGPTDRTYFNRWIDLWTKDDPKGPLREGADYQCVFYGGKLLSHLSAQANETETDSGINILNVNRKAILLMDRDRGSQEEEINETKQRMSKEVEKHEGLSWVTKGREIENYIPQQVLDALVPELNEIGQFEKVIDAINEKGSKKLEKVLFSEHVISLLTKENLENQLDLKEKIEMAITYIKKCNGR